MENLRVLHGNLSQEYFKFLSYSLLSAVLSDSLHHPVKFHRRDKKSLLCGVISAFFRKQQLTHIWRHGGTTPCPGVLRPAVVLPPSAARKFNIFGHRPAPFPATSAIVGQSERAQPKLSS